MERITGKLAAHYQNGDYAIIGTDGKEYVASKNSVIYEQDANVSFIPVPFQGPIIMATNIELITPEAASTEIIPTE